MTADSMVSAEAHSKVGLPPRPLPREGSNSGSNSSSNHNNNNNNSLSCGTPRDNLRRDLVRRRSTLTAVEHSFLENLIVHGNEIEVSLAREKLNDVAIFFEDDEELGDDSINSDDAFGNSIIIDREGSSFSHRTTPTSRPPLVPPHNVRRSQSNASRWSSVSDLSNRGSERMKKHLHERRTSSIHSNLWRAHETGLAVTPDASRKALIRRNSSSLRMVRNNSFLSTATQDLILSGGPTNRKGEDAIFRNNNKQQQQRGMDAASPRLTDVPTPTELSRFRSDASRKSVSFKDDVETGPRGRVPRRITGMDRNVSVESGLSEPQTPPPTHLSVPFESSESFPSLHRAKPVRSDSMANSSFASSSSLEDNNTWSGEISRGQLLRPPSVQASSLSPVKRNKKPVLLRKATGNTYQGEGIEVTELTDRAPSALYIDSLSRARNYQSLITSSFDETGDRDGIFRESPIPRSLSDEELSSYFLGSSKAMLRESMISLRPAPAHDDDSWEMDSDTEHNNDHNNNSNHDAWNVLKDEYASEQGMLPFRILGTSADDTDAHPHVLSPPLMESLQNFVPYGISEDNYWMKYSLLRDGASMHTLLQNVRGAKHTILAIETSTGEVFGSFTSEPWRKNWNFFGTGESFLWRMRQSRTTPCYSVIDQAQLESELDVYPWTGDNNCVQMCTSDKLAVGGGEEEEGGVAGGGGGGAAKWDKRDDGYERPVYGFGLALERNLLHGTSTHCATFGSPPLSREHPDGSPFEILNLEVWTFTPCRTLQAAEKLELGKLFLQSNSQ